MLDELELPLEAAIDAIHADAQWPPANLSIVSGTSVDRAFD
jgi:hypothetical protein